MFVLPSLSFYLSSGDLNSSCQASVVPKHFYTVSHLPSPRHLFKTKICMNLFLLRTYFYLLLLLLLYVVLEVEPKTIRILGKCSVS